MKKKLIRMTNHAAYRKVERGLRNCDICKILKFGKWEKMEDPNKYKVSMDKDLYVIYNEEDKVVISVINNKHIDSQGIYEMIKERSLQERNVIKKAIKHAPSRIFNTMMTSIISCQEKMRLARRDRRKMRNASIEPDCAFLDDYRIKY
ncbi:MAG: hypothetical protein HUK21_11360 [Fibrobacteraceae bacterium]|nr:hypothetical protein [Fibrobacteraceae bacterium]